jgi:hypothetical protein
MIDALTSIPGWQVFIWTLAISVPAAIHLRAVQHGDRARRAEVVLMHVLGVSGAIGMFNVALRVGSRRPILNSSSTEGFAQDP